MDEEMKQIKKNYKNIENEFDLIDIQHSDRIYKIGTGKIKNDTLSDSQIEGLKTYLWDSYRTDNDKINTVLVELLDEMEEQLKGYNKLKGV